MNKLRTFASATAATALAAALSTAPALATSGQVAEADHSHHVATVQPAESFSPTLIPIRQHFAYVPEHDCGPAALVMAMLSRGTVPTGFDPANVDGTTSAATKDMRYTAMGVPDAEGTSLQEVENGFAHYGVKSHVAGIEETIAWTQQGHGAIVAGDAGYSGFNWQKDMGAGFHGGHWVYVAGYDSSKGFKVMDPLATDEQVHYVSADALRGFSSFYSYQSNVIPS